jgi:tetratricopeptide (TPR) repeat protein
LDHFQKAADIDPKFTDAINDLGAALAKLGHTEQAAEQFRKALDLSPDDERILANLSLVLLRLRQYHEAGVMASRALKIDPRDVQICYVRAVALFVESGDNDEALHNLRRAAVQFPRARLMASKILAETGRRSEAVEELEEYLHSTPKSESNRAQVEARLAQLRQ